MKTISNLLIVSWELRRWWIVGLLGLTIFLLSRNTLNRHHSDPAPKEFSAYFPPNGEFRPSDAIRVPDTYQYNQKSLATEITVTLKEFKNLAQNSQHKPLVSHITENHQNGEVTVIDYWLWRDGFMYHARDNKSLSEKIDWGAFWYNTQWEYKAGTIWIAKAVWAPGWLYGGWIIGLVCAASCWGMAILLLAVRFIRYKYPLSSN